MKRVDWDKANILADIYKSEKENIYISSGDTFEESIEQDCYTFKFNKMLDRFISAKGVIADITAGAFSLNIYEYDEDTHLDFDIGIDI